MINSHLHHPLLLNRFLTPQWKMNMEYMLLLPVKLLHQKYSILQFGSNLAHTTRDAPGRTQWLAEFSRAVTFCKKTWLAYKKFRSWKLTFLKPCLRHFNTFHGHNLSSNFLCSKCSFKNNKTNNSSLSLYSVFRFFRPCFPFGVPQGCDVLLLSIWAFWWCFGVCGTPWSDL